MSVVKERSPLWYELPLLFIIAGGLIAYFKIRKDDPPKARDCLILGIVLTIPFVIVMGLYGTLFISSGLENPLYVVSSGSMEPNLNVFDVVGVSRVPFNEIKIGDIIVFHRPSSDDRVIVHRVAEILKDNPLTIRTKGDANPASIPGNDFPVTENEYIGKVVSTTPQIGYITRILAPPIIYIINAVQIGILAIPIIQHLRFVKNQNSLNIN